MTPPTSNIIKRRRFLAIPIVAAALAAVGLLPAVAGAANPHHHRFTAVAHNDEGTITPGDFFEDLVQSRASVDAPVYLNGEPVGAAETILTVHWSPTWRATMRVGRRHLSGPAPGSTERLPAGPG